jgi:hypothetical protein
MFLKPEDRRTRELETAILNTLRSIEEQLRLLTEALKPSQEHEDSASSNTSSDKKQAQPRPVITVHAVTQLGDADARKQEADRYGNYAFQEQTLWVQWLSFVATLLAFGAAAYYASIARQQLNTMNQTLIEAHIQNVAQQRALLGVDGNSIPLRGGAIGLRIKNQGRMAGKIVSCHMKYEQFRSNNASLVREEDKRIDSLVTPEEPFILSVTPPGMPPLAKGENLHSAGYLYRLR